MDSFEEWVKSCVQYPCMQKWADRLLELGASWDSFRRDRNEIVADLIEGGIPRLAARDIVNIASKAVDRSCAPMAIFWDLENMPIPSESSGRDVASRLKTILAPHGELVQFRGYASIGLGLIPQSKRSDLQLSGCHLVDCPHNGRKEVADKMIIVDAMQFAFMHPDGATLCFVTGDVDYAYLLAVLQRSQWRTIVVSKGTIQSMLHVNCDMKMRWETDILQMRLDEGISPELLDSEGVAAVSTEALGHRLVNSAIDNPFKPLTADEEWEDDVTLLRTVVKREGGSMRSPVVLKSLIGSILRQTNPARFPNREAIRTFFALAITKGVVIESGEGATKVLSLPPAGQLGNGAWLQLSNVCPIPRREIPDRVLEVSKFMPFFVIAPKYRCPPGTVFPKRMYTQFTERWAILLFPTLLDVHRTVSILPWLRSGTLLDWRKVEEEQQQQDDEEEDLDSSAKCSICGQVKPAEELLDDDHGYRKCPDCKIWEELDLGKKEEAVKRVVAMLKMMADNDDIYVAENILAKQLGLRYPDQCISRKLGSIWIQEAVTKSKAVSFKRPGMKSKLVCLPEQHGAAMGPFAPENLDTAEEEKHIEEMLWGAVEHVTRRQVIESLKQNFEGMQTTFARTKVFINGQAKQKFFVAKGLDGQMVGLTMDQAVAALNSLSATELPPTTEEDAETCIIKELGNGKDELGGGNEDEATTGGKPSDSENGGGSTSEGEESDDEDDDYDCLEAIFVKKTSPRANKSFSSTTILATEGLQDDSMRSQTKPFLTEREAITEPKKLQPPTADHVFNLRVDENGNRATKNLHVSGYGSGTSAKLLAKLFSEHAFVVEVVPKFDNLFCFVNTAHKDQAIQARQRLYGTKVNGGKLKINFAKES